MRILLVLMLIPFFAFAQKSEQQLAYQYYVNGEYDKAISIYEELMDKHFSVAYYNPYFISLLKVEDFKSAEYLAKKLVKKHPNSLNYQLEVAVVQEMSGNIKKAERSYKKLFAKIDGGQLQAINLANTFSRYEMYEKALDVYATAYKQNSQNNFGTQKAQLYSLLGKVELMIAQYLDVMGQDPRQKQMVITKIQRFLDNDGIKSDKNYQLVKKALLQKVRSEKVRTDFTEMLIWLFMQNHQFKMALLQAKALDKRTNSDGEVVYDLADSFLDKEYYDVAIEAYEYVISKGKQNYLYIDANINKLYALTKILSSSNNDISTLEGAYHQLITELGNNRSTVVLLSNYAHFKAFFLHDLEAAETLLLDAMEISGIDNYDLAECKMEYADVLLLQGNIWESLLYFSQVEKDFKEHPIGHEAKLRRAKISYFQGDFQWAQAQLETLKASTSKLIANDAMELSLLIMDNYNLDTTEISMRIFAKADLLSYQQKYEKALVKYDSVLTVFPGHTLSDEIYMRKAQIYFNQANYKLALLEYEKIEEYWAYDILADDAIYRRAKIYDDIFNNKENSMKMYEHILQEHNSSIYVAESRKRFRELRGDNLNTEK